MERKREEENRRRRILEYAAAVGTAFFATVEELIRVAKNFESPGEDVMFSFASLPKAKQAEAENALRHLHSVAKAITENGMKSEWLKSNELNDELVESVAGAVKGNPEFAGWFERNNQARNAFIKRRTAGLNLSDRIWKSVDQLKEEMEIALTISMGEGESAASASRKVKQYLNDPDLMFRRFRYKAGEDENGNPIYRKKWKKRIQTEDGRYRFEDYDKDDYKVAPGQYKSAARNAMRVTRTETNMAYRMADHERWQRFDFVLGQRIRTSRSHKEEDLCDDLAGDYPKGFVFTGWHPQCMCHCTPILISEEDMTKMSKARMKGEEYSPKQKALTEYPEGFKKWVSDNSEYIARKRAEGKEPYFIRDNAEAVERILEGNARRHRMAIQNYAVIGAIDMPEKEKNKLASDIKKVAKECGLFKRDFNIEFKDFGDGSIMTWSDKGTLSISTTIQRINKDTEICAAKDLRNAIDKLTNRKKLSMSFVEEYMIEVMYHENVHSKAKYIKTVSNTSGELIMEACTQLYAREKYATVLKKFGKTAEHFTEIKYNGLGYRDICDVLRPFFEKEGKIQIGELINIANGTEDGKKIMLSKIKEKYTTEEDVKKRLSRILYGVL